VDKNILHQCWGNTNSFWEASYSSKLRLSLCLSWRKLSTNQHEVSNGNQEIITCTNIIMFVWFN